MPVTLQDVLDTLRHPVVQRIDFWLEGLHIYGGGYREVADALEAKVHRPGSSSYRRRIEFVSGSEPGEDGTYYDDTNKLAISPDLRLDLFTQAIIVHEGTHAYVDLVRAAATTYFSNEVAAYIAEAVYLMLFSPTLRPRRDGSRFARMFHSVGDIVRQFHLDRPEGQGTRLEYGHYRHLRNLVHRIDCYRQVDLAALSGGDGV